MAKDSPRLNGKAMRLARAEADLSQRQLGALVGIAPWRVWRLECEGARPHKHEVVALKRVLGPHIEECA